MRNYLLLSECLDIAEDFLDEEDFELFRLKVESEACSAIIESNQVNINHDGIGESN